MKQTDKIDITILNPDCVQNSYIYPDQNTSSDSENFLDLKISEQNNYTSMTFSSRLAMFAFARELMSRALFDYSEIEFLPYNEEIGMLHDIKMIDKNARLFVFCNNENQINENDLGIYPIPSSQQQ